MAAIDNLKQAIVDLQTEIASLQLPADNSADVQGAADAVTAATASLKAKFPIV